ncbi:unnamed protein product [Candida verbasci]|uniref:ENTH domain-containing protein n=1 Tax=Candida verbasci TaxID=1227364 RepID=A0A9W4XLL4_9ASCO|nr:unnamed protein product [Candida verbasci]
MTFLQSIKNITSNTESIIKNATNTEPLGPYNHELIEISNLTYNKKHLSIIISILTRRLKYINDIFGNKWGNELTKSASIKRSFTYKSTKQDNNNSSSSNLELPKRSNTMSYKNHNYNNDSNLNKHCLILLKTLTVTLYLLQNGSQQFLDWIQSEYLDLIKPLTKIIYPNKYHESLKFKLLKILNLLDNESYLRNYRSNLHKLKTDLLVPGMKRTSLDNIDLLNVNDTEMMDQNYIYQRTNSVDSTTQNKARRLNSNSLLPNDHSSSAFANTSDRSPNNNLSNSPPTLYKQHTLSPLFN